MPRALLGACCATIAACAGRAAPPTGPRPTGALNPVVAEAALAEGKRVFEAVCVTCHTVVPPATLAPPMSHVVRHYREALRTDAAIVARIVEYVRTPRADRSLLPAEVRERFGLMPAQVLPDNQLRAVAAYVLTLTDPSHP